MWSIAGSSLANMFPTWRGSGCTAREAAPRFVEAHKSDLSSHKFNLQISNFHLLSFQGLGVGQCAAMEQIPPRTKHGNNRFGWLKTNSIKNFGKSDLCRRCLAVYFNMSAA